MLKKILRCSIAILLFFIFLNKIEILLERKDSHQRYASFFDNDNDFDVLFFGNSHIMMGISPLRLWRDYNISSYNLASGENLIPANYWVIINALDYKKPNLIVLDCHKISELAKISTAYNYLHTTFDAFPLSVNKIKAMLDLFDNSLTNQKGKVNALQLLWNISIYHSRWKELTKSDFHLSKDNDNGSGILYDQVNIRPTRDIETVEDEYTQHLVGVSYLKKIIEECKSRNIELLLTYLPCEKKDNMKNMKWQKEANTVQRIANEYGINFVNFFNKEFIDDNTDFASDGDHLNVSGATKITEYLGKYIIENYDNVNKRQVDWTEKYNNEVLATKKFHLDNNKLLELDLIVLRDKDYDLFIEVSDLTILANEYYKKFFENLGIDVGLVNDNVKLISVEDGGKIIQYYEDNCCDDITALNYSISNIYCKEKLNNDYSNNENSDIKIMIIDSKTHNVTRISNYYKSYDASDSLIYLEKE